MAKSTTTRQKYNFLIAFCRQLEEAADEGDEEYAEFRRVAESLFPSTGVDDAGVADRIAKIEQWIAQLENAVDELESVVSAFAGEDAELDDGSDEDADMERDEPQMGSRGQRHDSQPGSLAGARPGEAVGAVTLPTCMRRPSRG